MKIALLCVLLLSVVCFAQFDSTASTGATLNLQTVATTGNARHSELSATVTDQVEANNCRDRIHPVRNVRTQNGPLNSGTYFTVTISVNSTASQELEIQFGLPSSTNVANAYFDITGDSNGDGYTGTVGTCDSGSTCTFEYQCTQYPSTNSLEVRVSSEGLADGSVVSVGYTLSVTQYVEQVTEIGTSFTQSSPVSETLNTTTTLGGRNFAQYYHQFGQTNGVDLGRFSTYYVVASNFNTDITEAVLCISFDSIISNTRTTFDDNDESFPSPDDFSTSGTPSTVSATPEDDDDGACTSYCQMAAADSDIIYIPIYPCGLSCNLDDIWIGVRTETPSTFTLTVQPAADTAPAPVQVNSLPFTAEGVVSDLNSGNCLATIADLDYACEDYYVVNSATNIPSPSDSRLGPYMITHVYGPIGGNIDVDFSVNGLGGNSACCGSISGSCTGMTPSSDFSCYNVIAPCDFDRTADYVTTVTQTGSTDTEYPFVEYGIEIFIDSYDVETVSSTSSNFGTVEFGRQNHYKVTVNDNEIFDDSYFEVELYFPNEDGQNIGFAWNFNAPAGPANSCYDNMGVCNGDLDCDDFSAPTGNGDVYTLDSSAVPRCRFTFVDCVEPERETSVNLNRLQAGTYWFNVYDTTNGIISLNEYTEGVDYTLKFHLRRATPLFADRVTLGKVYDSERTAQYKFTLPDTPTDTRVIVDGVQNGEVTLYVECGRPAGRCPCGTFFDSCVASSFSGLNDTVCEVYIPSCACDADDLYVSIYGDADDNSVATRYAIAVEIVGDNEVIPILPVSRAGTTVNTLALSGSLNTNDYARELLSESQPTLHDTSIFELDMSNVVLQETDQLAVTFAFLSTVSYYTDDNDQNGDTGLTNHGLAVISKSPFGLPLTESFTEDNLDFTPRRGCEYVSCVAHPTGFNNVDEQDLLFSSCTIVLSNCNAGCGNGLTLNDKLYVRVEQGDALQVNTHVSITAEIRPEFVVPLAVAVPQHAATSRLAYQHYSFSPSGAAANSRLVFKAYSPANSWPLEVFANYVAPNGERVLAGRTSDCYNNILCEPCQLNYQGSDNVCIHEISPCVLSTESGTYYLSVSEISLADTVHSGEGFTGNPYAIPFTLEAYYEPITNLLAVDSVLHQSIYREETAYYFVNIPTGSRDTLRVEIEANNNAALVGLSFTQPDDQCVACATEERLEEGTVRRLNYYPCDLPDQSTLYISVRMADVGSDCEKLDYVLHAHLDQITQTSLTLVNAASPLTAINNSTGRVTLSNGEFQVYSFSANAADGEYLTIDITQSNPAGSTPQSFAVYLSTDAPDFPASSTAFGSASGSCGTRVGQCTSAQNLDGAPCQIRLEPCAYESATYYLTFDGTAVGAGEQTNPIDILIREYGVETVRVPTTLGTTISNDYTDNAVYTDFPRRSLRASGVSIQGGTNIRFEASGSVSNMYIRLGDETQSGCGATCTTNPCTLYACETVSSRDLYIYIEQSNSAAFTVDITVSDSDSRNSTSVTTLNLNSQRNFTALSNSGTRDQFAFQYISFTIPQTDVGYFDLDTNLNFGPNGDVYSYTNGRRFLPGFTAGANERTIDNTLTTGSTCGFSPVTAAPEDECCFDAQTYDWVVVGRNSPYSITVNYVADNTNAQNVNIPATITDGFTGTQNSYDMYTFSASASDDIILTFNVTAGNARIYLNYGSTAGAGNDDPENDLSSCYRNANTDILAGTSCDNVRSAGDNQCVVYLQACSRGCVGESSTRYAISVVNENDDEAVNTAYRLTLTSSGTTQTITSGRNSEQIPFISTTQIGQSNTQTNLGGSRRLGGNFVYNVPNSVVDSLRGNQIPPRAALVNGDEDFYPQVQFNFTNFRNAAGNDIDASQFDIEVAASSCGGNDLDDGFCDIARQTTSTYEYCARSLCNFGCSDSLSFFVANTNDNNIDRFSFDVIVNEVVNGLTTNNLQERYLYDTLSVGGNGDSSSGTATQIDSVFIRASFAGLSANQYRVLTISIDNVSGTSGAFAIKQYGSACGASTTLPAPCNSLSDGESCTIVYDPCTTDIESLDNTVFIFEIDAPARANFTYSFGYEIRSVSFIDTSATRLTPGGVSSYSANKEIGENTWQFYQIEVTENDGYSYLDIAVNNFGCRQTGESLEVYTSFVYDATVHREIVTPSRYPTQGCNVASYTSNGFSENFDTCKTVAGLYQIGVWAPNDIQLVDDNDFTAPFPVRNVQYSISASLTTLDYILAVPGCSLVQTVGSTSYVPRIELRLEALPANSRVVMGISTTGSAIDFAYGLTAPEGNDANGECDLPNRFVDADSGIDFVIIDACDVESETYYIYLIGGATGDVVTFYSEIEYNYAVQLPTTSTFSHTTNLALRSTLYQDEDLVSLLAVEDLRFTQYYRYDVTAASEITVSTTACADCVFDVSIIAPEYCPDFSCGNTTLVCDGVSTCAFEISSCASSYPNNEFVYIAVTRQGVLSGDASQDANCTVTIEGNALFSSLSNARALTNGQTVCEPVACRQLYQITGDANQRASSVEEVVIDSDVALTVYSLQDGSSCPAISTCAANTPCTIQLSSGCSLVNYLYVVIDDCTSCAEGDSLYSIAYSRDTTSTTTLSLGSTLSVATDSVLVTVPAGTMASYTASSTVNYVERGSLQCTTQCAPLLTPSDPTTPTQYVFSNVPAGFQVSSVSTTALSGSRSISLQDAGFEYLRYTVPAGVRQVEFSFANIEAIGAAPTNIRYALSTDGPVIPSSGSCGTTCDNFDTLASDSCNGFNTITYDVCEGDIVYMTVGLCADTTCGVSFDVSVSAGEAVSFPPASDRQHTVAWTKVSTQIPSGACSSNVNTDTTVNFSVDVEDILFVALRDPRNGPASVSVSQCGVAGSSTCSVNDISVGVDATTNDYSCAVSDRTCTGLYCVAPGTYDVTINGISGGSVEYQFVNQWVSLTSSASDSLRGREAHFYEIGNADQALSVVLSVSSGPAVEFTLTEGCSTGSAVRYQETKTCAFGDCPIWIPTGAESPRASSLYVIIDSQTLATGRFNNENLAKDTEYTITVTRGTANCAAPPSSGFCADSSSGSVNVFSTASNAQVWRFSNTTAKNLEAQCYYNTLLDGACSISTQVCRNYLKTLACLTVFPQCDASGYQMPVCNDLCSGLAAACGDDQALLNNLGCGSDRFALNSNGTCVTNALSSSVNPPQETRIPAVSVHDAALPQQLVAPQFAPIYATMPALILDDDDGAKLLENFKEVKASETSSASALLASFFLLLVLLF